VELNASQNQLKTIPKTIGNLSNLMSLHLQNNLLNNLPNSIGNCTNLKNLYLGYNKLKEIPLTIRNLQLLQSLSIEHNELAELTYGIGQCSSLASLDIQSNRLKKLPPTLGFLNTVLTNLNIKDNEIDTKDNTETILNELAYFMEANEKLTRVNLMILGAETTESMNIIFRFSKKWVMEDTSTNLLAYGTHDNPDFPNFTFNSNINPINFYVSEEDSSPKNVLSTRPGAFLHRGHFLERIRSKKGVPITVHVQYLLGRGVFEIHSRKPTCLLMFLLNDLKTEKCVDFWLEHLKLYAPDSTVILVAIYSEDSIPEDQLPKKQSEITKTYKKFGLRNIQVIMIGSESGMDDLRAHLETILSGHPLIGETYPNSYYVLEYALVDLRRRLHAPVISLQQTFVIAKICGIHTMEDTLRAIRLLSELGTIVYYPNDHILKDIVILDPYWTVRMVSSYFEK